MMIKLLEWQLALSFLPSQNSEFSNIPEKFNNVYKRIERSYALTW